MNCDHTWCVVEGFTRLYRRTIKRATCGHCGLVVIGVDGMHSADPDAYFQWLCPNLPDVENGFICGDVGCLSLGTMP